MKCKYCKTDHKNKIDGKIGDTCYNCNFLVDRLNDCVKALNMWTPSMTGKNNRRIIIKDFEIIKIK